MEINETNFNKNISDIKTGELFKVEYKLKERFGTLYDGIFMKLNVNKNQESCNAVRLNDGLLYHFKDDKKLEIVHGVLNI